jgi:phage gp36-like protein
MPVYALSIAYSGPPAHSLYATVRRRGDGFVFRTDTEAFEAWLDANVADYAVGLSNLGGGEFGLAMPAGLPADTYDVDFFDQAGAAPAYPADLQLPAQAIYWNGQAATSVPPGYTGRYTSVGLMKIRVGQLNVTAWSDTSGTGTENTAAEQWAIDTAENELDDRMRGGKYAIPFIAPVPISVQKWATDIALFYLYTSRGLQDGDPVADRLKANYEAALRWSMLAKGSDLLRLDAPRNARTPTVPTVVLAYN